MGEQHNLALLGSWDDAYTEGGVEAALALVDEIFSSDVEFSPLLARQIDGSVCRGRDELRAFFRDLNDMLGEVTYSPSEYRPVGERLVVQLTHLHGAGRSSAVPVDRELGLVHEFENGQVRRFTAYGSYDEAFEAARELQRA